MGPGGHTIEMDKWEKLWKVNLNFTACTGLKENYYKMIYRWYLTPKKLALMYKGIPNKCWKCKQEIGSFIHMWWNCKEAKRFWEMIYNELKRIFKLNFPKNPETFLLGIEYNVLPKNFWSLFMYLTTAARLVYAQQWKNVNVPNKDDWLNKVLELAEMAKLTALIRDQYEIFKKDWKPLLVYLEKYKQLNFDVAFEED